MDTITPSPPIHVVERLVEHLKPAPAVDHVGQDLGQAVGAHLQRRVPTLPSIEVDPAKDRERSERDGAATRDPSSRRHRSCSTKGVTSARVRVAVPRHDPGMSPLPFALVGHGWRADFFLRLAAVMPERFACTGVVTRRARCGEAIERRWGVRTFRSIDACSPPATPSLSSPRFPGQPTRTSSARSSPTTWPSSPRPRRPPTSRASAACGATSARAGSCRSPSSTVPPRARRPRPDRRRGRLGAVTSAWLSWTHGYHAVAVLRLAAARRGRARDRPDVERRRPTRAGAGPLRPARRRPSTCSARHTVATLQFPAGIGTYDFTDGQWFHPLRRRHVIVRGSRGEVVGTSVVWATGDGRPLEAPLVRRQTGLTATSRARTSTRSPGPAALSTPTPIEGQALRRGDRRRDGAGADAPLAPGDGEPPYPLAQGCQDHLISLAIDEAGETGRPVTTGDEPWAAALG